MIVPSTRYKDFTHEIERPSGRYLFGDRTRPDRPGLAGWENGQGDWFNIAISGTPAAVGDIGPAPDWQHIRTYNYGRPNDNLTWSEVDVNTNEERLMIEFFFGKSVELVMTLKMASGLIFASATRAFMRGASVVKVLRVAVQKDDYELQKHPEWDDSLKTDHPEIVTVSEIGAIGGYGAYKVACEDAAWLSACRATGSGPPLLCFTF